MYVPINWLIFLGRITRYLDIKKALTLLFYKR